MSEPDLVRCPRCGEDRLLTETDDALFVTCDVCSFTFGKDRPAMNENDKELLKRHHRILDGKDKPWGTY